MKKIFTRCLAVMCSIAMLSTMTIFGAEIEEKPVLSIEEAITSAYSESNDLIFNLKQQKILEEKVKISSGSSFVEYETLDIQRRENARKEDYIRDQIAYDVTNRYQNLINLEQEIKNLEQEILVQTKSLNQMSTQKDKGLISGLQYQAAELELKSLETSLKTKIETLSSDKSYFKLITGKDLKDYSLDEELIYEPFHIEGSVERYCNDKATVYNRYNKERADLKKNYTPFLPTDAEYSNYLTKVYGMDLEVASVEDATKSMTQSMMMSYSNLLNLEEQISSLQQQIEFTKKQLETTELQYKLGLKTKLDCEKQELNVDKLEANLRVMICNYNKLKTTIEKPWAAMQGI